MTFEAQRPLKRLGFAADTTAETFVELVDTTASIHNFLLAGVERVAARANVDVDFTRAGGLGRNNVAATTCGFHFFVFGMDICLHNFRLECCRTALPVSGHGTVAC